MNVTVLAHVEWWHFPFAFGVLALIVAAYVVELDILRDIENDPFAEVP